MKQVTYLTIVLVNILLLACQATIPGLGATPIPSEIKARTGEIVRIGTWAISVEPVYQDSGNVISSVYISLKNASATTQPFDVGRLEILLLDAGDFIVSQASVIGFSNDEQILIPKGMSLSFLTNVRQPPKFSKIVVGPKVLGSKITFEVTGPRASSMTSDELVTSKGETIMLGDIQISLLSVQPDPDRSYEITVELGVENTKPVDTDFQWKMWGIDNSWIIHPYPNLDFHFIQSFINPIPAKSKTKCTFVFSSQRNISKILIHDKKGNVGVFKVK